MTGEPAILALADGTVFCGRALGFSGETSGEVVFNTAMTGYQEILTDPSYNGQIVVMTCPHIGNYGLTREDEESRAVWAEGFVVKESTRRPSNWRGEASLHDYLEQKHVVGIQGIDTRALTRHLRDAGAQTGVISHLDRDPQRVVEKAKSAPSIIGRDLVAEVSCKSPFTWTSGTGTWGLEQGGRTASERSFRVVAYDFGIKHNILRQLVESGCSVTVVPASTSAAEVLAMNPDGIVLSNGPGDPEGVPYAVDTVRELLGKRPIFAICLGHQMVGLALGLKSYKLKFGHHAANHPVKDLRSSKVQVTSQNHGFAVGSSEGFDRTEGDVPMLETSHGPVSISHLSLNDLSIEGLVAHDIPLISVQYHPEASPGPHDSAFLFRQFTQMMEQPYAS